MVLLSGTVRFFSLQNGDAPLHIAVALGRKRMAKKLIRLGASGHIRNNVSMLLSRLKSHYLPSRGRGEREISFFYEYTLLTMRGLKIRHGQFSMKSKFCDVHHAKMNFQTFLEAYLEHSKPLIHLTWL